MRKLKMCWGLSKRSWGPRYGKRSAGKSFVHRAAGRRPGRSFGVSRMTSPGWQGPGTESLVALRRARNSPCPRRRDSQPRKLRRGHKRLCRFAANSGLNFLFPLAGTSHFHTRKGAAGGWTLPLLLPIPHANQKLENLPKRGLHKDVGNKEIKSAVCRTAVRQRRL